jgi:caa(3)-type oxidase subunit IV
MMRLLVITGIGLILLATASWILSAIGAPITVSLVIAAIKALWILWVFMELAHEHVVPRTVAVVMVLFIALLIAGTMCDVELRR